MKVIKLLSYGVFAACVLSSIHFLNQAVGSLKSEVKALRESQENMARTMHLTKDALHVRNLLDMSKRKSFEVTATAYTGKAPKTATMTKPRQGKTLAVSRDMAPLLGSKVYIPGHGVMHVEDLMEDERKKAVDFFVGSLAEAREFGSKQIKLIVLN